MQLPHGRQNAAVVPTMKHSGVIGRRRRCLGSSRLSTRVPLDSADQPYAPGNRATTAKRSAARCSPWQSASRSPATASYIHATDDVAHFNALQFQPE
jgi:hypothetical protein